MNSLRLGLLTVVVGLFMAGCASTPSQGPYRQNQPQAQVSNMPVVPTPTSERDGMPAAHTIPPNVADIPNAVPKAQPLSKSGNPKAYEAFGKIYHVLTSARGFEQKGYASWYGRKFQGRPTASGEPYNMFAMTAAHKTLPIPSYVRVTNLQNHRQVIVRINDRGPFHKGRIIDLSYAAALKLGIVHHGTAMVEISAITPGPVDEKPSPGRYLQAGAYHDPVGAIAMRERLLSHDVKDIELTNDEVGNDPIHRVLIGPFSSARKLDAVRRRLMDDNIPTHPVTR